MPFFRIIRHSDLNDHSYFDKISHKIITVHNIPSNKCRLTKLKNKTFKYRRETEQLNPRPLNECNRIKWVRLFRR